MMTTAIVLVVFAVVIVGLRLRGRGSKASDLGAVSESWLAEESATGPRRY